MDTTVRVNHPEDLCKVTGNGFGKLRYIRPISESVKLHTELFQSTGQFSSTPQPASLSVASQPQLLLPTSVKSIFQKNDWKGIQKLQQQTYNDLAPILNNLNNNPDHAWVHVRDETDPSQQFYMAWDSSGNYVWCWCSAVKTSSDPFNPNIKLIAPTQYGIYSNTTSIAGVVSYNLGFKEIVPELVAASILSHFICKVINKGLGFDSSDLTKMLDEAAVQAGCELEFTISPDILGAVCSCVMFSIAFIGNNYLFSWFNKKFLICLSVYNWDTTNDWQLPVQSLSNAVNPGEAPTNDLNINIAKQIPPGSNPFGNGVEVPSSLESQLRKTVEAAINYASLFYISKSSYSSGCSFALKCTKNNSSSGFSYAFQCLWVASNGHYIENVAQNPDSFLIKAGSHWVNSTAPLTTTVEGMPIRCYIDALTGGDAFNEHSYQVAVHIDPSN
ncbi:hypothetical protein CYY_008004 [Polysphondylium violaceum]|uniref:Uncharacterized protein n=1 Tax=Polysphondylium violaceum TaxID=133409 RepID=A0A8J4UXM9_9MYCE|nr:hypothetical protein CYY_008004 [Polysphondylium violaceum]